MKFVTILIAALSVAGVSFTSCIKDEFQIQEPTAGLKFNTEETPLCFKFKHQTKELSFISGFITQKELQCELETKADFIKTISNY